jgi:hypothetical protein
MTVQARCRVDEPTSQPIPAARGVDALVKLNKDSLTIVLSDIA